MPNTISLTMPADRVSAATMLSSVTATRRGGGELRTTSTAGRHYLLHAPTIVCAGCKSALEEQLSCVPGLSDVRVEVTPQTLTLTIGHPANLAQMLSVLADTGHRVDRLRQHANSVGTAAPPGPSG